MVTGQQGPSVFSELHLKHGEEGEPVEHEALH